MRLRQWILASSILWACSPAQAELAVNGNFEVGDFNGGATATLSGTGVLPP